MNKVLIDTCAWIDFLRSKEGVLGNHVASLIDSDQALLCGVIITELLQGAKGKKEKQQLEFLISGIEILDINRKDWIDAGLCLQELRSKGITLPLTDALIAVLAIRLSVPVLTIDKHFDHLSVTVLNPTVDKHDKL
jgi:predicted nucleic acid-binding protein